LTQGWGTEGDLANVAGKLLARLGYKPSLRKVAVTDKGREALKELADVEEVKTTELPAWAFADDQGKNQVYVIPFMKSLSELDGKVYLPGGQKAESLHPNEANIRVFYDLEEQD